MQTDASGSRSRRHGFVFMAAAMSVAVALSGVVTSAEAAKSGFSGSRSSFSSSRSSSSFSSSRSSGFGSSSKASPSYKSTPSAPAATGKSVSGFGSSAPKAAAPSVAGKAVAATALGGALYSAQASKSAADSVAAAGANGAGAASVGAGLGGSQSSSGTVPSTRLPSSTPLPTASPSQPTVVHHDSGNSLLWYLIGSSMGSHANTAAADQKVSRSDGSLTNESMAQPKEVTIDTLDNETESMLGSAISTVLWFMFAMAAIWLVFRLVAFYRGRRATAQSYNKANYTL